MRYSLESVPYIEEGLLGSGSFAQVYKVKIDNQYYALKRFHPYQLQDITYYESAMREINILRKLDHPNILKLYDVYQGDNYLQLLLEYVPKGNLYQMVKQYERLPEYLAKNYVKGVVQALKYLHSFAEPILHRDIKPENILVGADNQVKVCDFGSANLVLADHVRTSYVGTSIYMAPEMKESRPHDQSLDMWCLGILIYELLTGDPPQGYPLQFPDYMSKPAEDLIRRILIENPKNRLSINEIEDHIWFCEKDQISLSRFSFQKTQESQSEFIARIRNRSKAASSKIQKRRQKRAMDLEEEQNPFNKTESHLSMASKASNSTKEREEYISQYFAKLEKLAQLKYEKRANDKKIEQMKQEKEVLELFELEEVKMMEATIQEYRGKIAILKGKETKPSYQVIESLRNLVATLDQLLAYTARIPQRYRQEILVFSDIMVEDIRLPDSEYLPKLKHQMLNIRRDALIELKCILKRQQQMPELAFIEDDLISRTAYLSQNQSQQQLMMDDL